MSTKWYSWQMYQSCAVLHRGLGGYKWRNRFIESFRSFFSSLSDREKGRVVGTSVWSCCQANSGTYAIFTWRNLSMQLIQIFSNVKIWFQVAHSNLANVCTTLPTNQKWTLFVFISLTKTLKGANKNWAQYQKINCFKKMESVELVVQYALL